MSTSNKLVYRIGFWSAVLAAVTSVFYSVAQISAVVGLLASPWDLVLMFAPSLLLAWAFVVLMVSVHYYASDEKKIWSHIGLIFAVIYTVLVSIVYFVELTVVVPRIFQGDTNEVTLLLFDEGSFMVAVDGLGYGFMSLATLFAGLVFRGGRLERWTRWFLLANGILAPVIVGAVLYPALVIVGALWIITLPGSTILLAVLFNQVGEGRLERKGRG